MEYSQCDLAGDSRPEQSLNGELKEHQQEKLQDDQIPWYGGQKENWNIQIKVYHILSMFSEAVDLNARSL